MSDYRTDDRWLPLDPRSVSNHSLDEFRRCCIGLQSAHGCIENATHLQLMELDCVLVSWQRLEFGWLLQWLPSSFHWDPLWLLDSADSVSSLPEAPLAYARGLDAEEEPLSVIHVLGLNLDRDPVNFEPIEDGGLEVDQLPWHNYTNYTTCNWGRIPGVQCFRWHMHWLGVAKVLRTPACSHVVIFVFPWCCESCYCQLKFVQLI